MPYPHFSYQIAGGYDRPAVETTLSRLAKEIEPFEVRTEGLATFEGKWPVVYVSVRKDPTLRALHSLVWNACLPTAFSPVSYYRPDVWTPHITLAHGEESNSVPLSLAQVRATLNLLKPTKFDWTVSIDNFALVWDDGKRQSPARTYALRG
jgi:2'-5' RNA ligase